MIIELKSIEKTYNKGHINQFQALTDINLKVDEQEVIAIVGASGSGKTTLLNIIGLVDNYELGSYFLNGENVKTLRESQKAKLRNRVFGYVMQDYSLIPQMSIFDNVAIPLYIANVPYKEIKSRVRTAVSSVNLHDIVDKKVTELSGGQKQRVAIARAIVNNPQVILADEPTGALDKKTGVDIIDELLNLRNLGKSVLIVTHDMEIASKCSRILTIDDGTLL